MKNTLTPELDRASTLASRLKFQVEHARRGGGDRVSLNIDDAEELMQLLYDSLRTAQEIIDGATPAPKVKPMRVLGDGWETVAEIFTPPRPVEFRRIWNGRHDDDFLV